MLLLRQRTNTHLHHNNDQQTAEQDNTAAKWWAGGRPSTNDSANADIEAFWQKAAQTDAAVAITHLTGKDTAVAVKQAGRGSHVTLGFLGTEHTRSSK